MAFNLPIKLHGPDQLEQCAEELHALAAAMNRARQPLPDLSVESQAVIVALDPAAEGDPAAIEAAADELEAQVARAPRITVTLAALAPHTLRDELVGWMRQELHSQVLVTFQANPDIAGGMVLRTTNKFHDFSFRTQLLKNPDEFTKVLNRV